MERKTNKIVPFIRTFVFNSSNCTKPWRRDENSVNNVLGIRQNRLLRGDAFPNVRIEEGYYRDYENKEMLKKKDSLEDYYYSRSEGESNRGEMSQNTHDNHFENRYVSEKDYYDYEKGNYGHNYKKRDYGNDYDTNVDYYEPVYGRINNNSNKRENFDQLKNDHYSYNNPSNDRNRNEFANHYDTEKDYYYNYNSKYGDEYYKAGNYQAGNYNDNYYNDNYYKAGNYNDNYYSGGNNNDNYYNGGYHNDNYYNGGSYNDNYYRDGYHNDNYYSGGYYNDNYYSDGYHNDNYYRDGYHQREGFPLQQKSKMPLHKLLLCGNFPGSEKYNKVKENKSSSFPIFNIFKKIDAKLESKIMKIFLSNKDLTGVGSELGVPQKKQNKIGGMKKLVCPIIMLGISIVVMAMIHRFEMVSVLSLVLIIALIYISTKLNKFQHLYRQYIKSIGPNYRYPSY
ncbi:Plasmodium exported protein, unknown function [Plasmodium vivax]|uniref:Pv-fam-d protein n=1 Tax=Plasmodium vivax TaxID=5855 RepID=A0A1G4EI47_PLAVI|nr:Plasmodium exported protein, unknown function [Plasmodium vivax]